MRLSKPIKIPVSLRLLKADKDRVYKLTDNFSWYTEIAILEKLDRDEERIRHEFDEGITHNPEIL